MSDDEPKLDRAKLEEMAARWSRDPVLHETMSAIAWLCHAVKALAAGNGELADHLATLAWESVLAALKADDLKKGSPGSGA